MVTALICFNLSTATDMPNTDIIQAVQTTSLVATSVFGFGGLLTHCSLWGNTPARLTTGKKARTFANILGLFGLLLLIASPMILMSGILSPEVSFSIGGVGFLVLLFPIANWCVNTDFYSNLDQLRCEGEEKLEARKRANNNNVPINVPASVDDNEPGRRMGRTRSSRVYSVHDRSVDDHETVPDHETVTLPDMPAATQDSTPVLISKVDDPVTSSVDDQVLENGTERRMTQSEIVEDKDVTVGPEINAEALNNIFSGWRRRRLAQRLNKILAN